MYAAQTHIQQRWDQDNKYRDQDNRSEDQDRYQDTNLQDQDQDNIFTTKNNIRQ